MFEASNFNCRSYFVGEGLSALPNLIEKITKKLNVIYVQLSV